MVAAVEAKWAEENLCTSRQISTSSPDLAIGASESTNWSAEWLMKPMYPFKLRGVDRHQRRSVFLIPEVSRLLIFEQWHAPCDDITQETQGRRET